MKEQISKQLQLARDKYIELHNRIFIYSIEHSIFPEEVKERYLIGRVSDPSLAASIGTPDFFKEAVLTIWGLHQEFLAEHDRRIGEGKLELLWNLMGANGETETIPPKEVINTWAESLPLPGLLIIDLMEAAGYGVDYERVRSEQYYYDSELLGEMLGENRKELTPTLAEVLRIHAFLLAGDLTRLASHILKKIRR